MLTRLSNRAFDKKYLNWKEDDAKISEKIE